jgi:plastocyanin
VASINKRTAKRLARLTALLVLTVLALLIGVTTAGAQRQIVVTVAIRDFYFEPSQLIIEPGTAVQWVNESTSQHTVFATSPAGAFRSGTLHPGESFTHTFPQRFPKASPDSRTKPGTYEYLCEIHPGMKASVTFSESGGKAPTQKEVPAQGREGTSIQQPPAVPRGGEVSTQEREDTAIQQPPTAPRTGGLDPLLLIGLLVVIAALGVLGWVVRRRSSQSER